MAVPLASRANGNSDISRRSWINTLNSELKAGIDDDAVKTNPLPLALFGVAQSMMPAPQALDAVQRIDERHFLVRHQNS